MSKDTSFPICVLRRLVQETPTIDLTHYKIDLKINSSVKTASLEYMPVRRPRLWATMWHKCLDWVHFSIVLFPFKGPLDVAVKYIERFCLGTYYCPVRASARTEKTLRDKFQEIISKLELLWRKLTGEFCAKNSTCGTNRWMSEEWSAVKWRPPFGRCSVLAWGDEYNELRPFCAMLMFCSALWMYLLSWTLLWK